MSASLDYASPLHYPAGHDTADDRSLVEFDTALSCPSEDGPIEWVAARSAGSTRQRNLRSPAPVTRIYPALPDVVDVPGDAGAARQAPDQDLAPSGPDTATSPGTAVAEPRISRWPESDRSVRVGALLAEMAACQDPVERKRLQSAVVVEHLSVAKSIASRYRGRGVERGDLEQLAYLGLVKAASRWLPGLSDDFLQFAVPTISGEIKRYFRDHSWLVRPPRRIQELRAAISVAERDFQDSGELRPSDRLVGERLGVSETEIREARTAAGLCRPPSMDAESGAGMFIAQQWSGDDCTTDVDDRMSLDVVLRTLTPRERTVVRMRYSDGLSQARIGELIGVSQMQVSRILRDVLAKLRDRWEH